MKKREQLGDELRQSLRNELYFWLYSKVDGDLYSYIWNKLERVTRNNELRDKLYSYLSRQKSGTKK